MAIAVILIIVVVTACCILPLVGQLIKKMSRVITGQFPVQIAPEGEDGTLSLYEVPTNDQTREGAYIEMIELQTLNRKSSLYELSQEGLGDI